MRRADALWLSFVAAAWLAIAPAAAAPEPTPRHRAGIEVTQHAPFVVLPLDPATYARSESPALADLRVVDARGSRVPFAMLPPVAPDVVETARDIALYALPARTQGEAWPVPFELRLRADGLTLVQRDAPKRGPAAVGGWLFDLGEQPRSRADARRLELRWPANAADFGASYRLQTSDDLQRWRAAPGGHLLGLAGSGGMPPLMQARVALPASPPRFVRLEWDAADARQAPKLLGARLVLAPPPRAAGDEPTRLVVAPLAGAVAADTLDGRALVFDLGGALPLASIDLDVGAGTRVVPFVVDVRVRDTEPWRPLARHAHWQLERDGATTRSEPLRTDGLTARQLRIVGDERAARLDPAATRLVIQARPARLVIATEGEAPLALLVGLAKATPGALPVSTLVPDLDAERARLGRASLGSWSEVPEAAARARHEARVAAWRPRLLWGVLVAGVAALGWMAWRLARNAPRAGS